MDHVVQFPGARLTVRALYDLLAEQRDHVTQARATIVEREVILVSGVDLPDLERGQRRAVTTSPVPQGSA